MNDLTSAKLQKLQEQRELSDKLNNVLTKEGGLIQSGAPAPPRLGASPAATPAATPFGPRAPAGRRRRRARTSRSPSR